MSSIPDSGFIRLPQIIGDAITTLQKCVDAGITYSPWPTVGLFGALVFIRAVVGFVLGPLRNRTIQRTLGDIRAAIYDALSYYYDHRGEIDAEIAAHDALEPPARSTSTPPRRSTSARSR